MIGTIGGSVAEATGAQVIFPAGAVTTDTTFRIAVDSTGAPPVPAQMGGTGNIYVITPHGGNFEKEVEVRIPAPSITLQPNQELKIAKAEPGGNWVILNDTRLVDGKLSVRVHDFSFFMGVVVTYVLPIAQAAPLSFTTSLVCEGHPTCTDIDGSTFTGTFTAVGNNGQIPANWCGQDAGLYIGHGISSQWLSGPRLPISGSGGSITATATAGLTDAYTFGVFYGTFIGGGYCLYNSGFYRNATFRSMPAYPGVSVISAPDVLDVVEGLTANVDVIVGGGAVERPNGSSSYQRTPQFSDHATVDWERSDNGGASWRVVARSFQNEGNPLPYGSGNRWQPWSVRHAFAATIGDQGALLRARACYTPPAPVVAPPCSLGRVTRINVLQQSTVASIGEQPRSVLIRSGETANFSVGASGLPSPTLRWQSRAANSTGEWADVTGGTGATSASYTTPPRELTDNGLQYRVVVSNALGTVTSSPVTVSVSDLNVAPSITTQPASISVTSGSDAVFAAVVYGTEALSYQWRFNGTNIDGANSPILRLTGVTNADAGNYSLYVSNAAGNAASNTATLQVTAGTPAAVAPTIVTQPVSLLVSAGNSANFAVGANGTGPLSFQWRRDGANIPGATSPSLSFNSVQLPNAGTYSVVVTNSAGAVVSNNVMLEVAPAVAGDPPTITSHPFTLVVPAGGSAMLAVGATGSGPLSYQWTFNGAPIPGATLPVLSLSNVGNSNVGDYRATVTNSVSSVNSEVAELILLGAPVITQDPVATTGIQGNSVTFSVSANGSGLRYQWLRNGNQIPGATDASYTTPTLVEANTGAVYSVMVYNGAGMVTSQGAVLTVQVVITPSILQQPANVSVQAGQPATLCVAFGGSLPMMAYLQRWTGTWTNSMEIIVSGDQANCFFTAVLQLADDGAQFRFLARNAAGEVLTNTATITVTAPPPQGITGLTLASPALGGGFSNHNASRPQISANGRYVAFNSFASDLVAGFPQPPVGMERNHAFLRDLITGTTTLINQTTSGGVSTHDATNLRLSANGRYALFSSLAGDQVADDNNGSFDVFRRDLQTGTTVAVNVLPNGQLVDGGGNASGDLRLSISADGRFVTFISTTDVATGGSGGSNDGYFLYVRDMQSGFTRYVDGTQGPNQVMYVEISNDGEWIAYEHYHGPTDTVSVVLYDIEANLYFTPFSYVQGTFPAGSRPGMSVSADGRYVVFAMNVQSITGSTHDQVMLVDRDNPGVATVVSTGPNGAGDGGSNYPRISGDGRYVMFDTGAPNLTGGVAQPWQRYPVIRDRVAGVTLFGAHRMNGTPLPVTEYGSNVISSDGSTIAFVANHSEVVGGSPMMQIFAEPRQ